MKVSLNIPTRIFRLYNRPNQKFIEAPLREPISQWSHLIQCYANAKKRGYTESLTVACMLHDIGHFVNPNFYDLHPSYNRIHSHLNQRCIDVNSGIDDHHEMKGSVFLSDIGFPLSVTDPIKYHAVAKYEKCMLDKKYKDSLSSASKTSLQSQIQTDCFHKTYFQFKHSVFYKNAMMLREVDDESKKVLTDEQLDELGPLEEMTKLIREVLGEVNANK